MFDYRSTSLPLDFFDNDELYSADSSFALSSHANGLSFCISFVLKAYPISVNSGVIKSIMLPTSRSACFICSSVISTFDGYRDREA